MSTLHETLSQELEAQKQELAKTITEIHWAQLSQKESREYDKYLQDAGYHLSYLAQAIAAASLPLWTSYIEWVYVLFRGLRLDTRGVSSNLEIIEIELTKRFPESAALIHEYIARGLDVLAHPLNDAPSYLDAQQPHALLARQYLDALRRGQRALAMRLVRDAIAQGTSIRDLYKYVFEPVQHEVGRLWQTNQINVAQEHYFTAATQLLMSQLYAEITNTPKNGRRMVATCIGSELHEIGLRMVTDYFEMDGWDTYYLGANTPTKDILKTLDEFRVDLLAVSATMTYHVPFVKDLIASVRAADPKRRTTILVGGYPFNVEPELWRHVGADGYASNAEKSVIKANALLNSGG